MTRADLDKAPAEVAAMFDDVAERYDITNDVLALGQTRRWRTAVEAAVAPQPGERVLDLAAGTGTSSVPFAKAGATVVPTDFSLGMLRVGKRAIVSFPNFAHWQVRLRLVFGGRMPETPSLPYKWYDTPNIHLCSIDDFRALCRDMGVTIERAVVLNRNSQPIRMPPPLANLIGEQAVFLLRRD